jgi:UDP-N-acetyl-D-glucosamine dehydrogenase
MTTLGHKISSHTATIAVIGLGYVGLPLAVALAEAGFRVTGVDVDADRVEAINRGESYLSDISGDALSAQVRRGQLQATADYDCLMQTDVILICVPTPFHATKDPDLSFVIGCSQDIAQRLRSGQMVILQSTTYPGTTEEVVLPILERSGLTAGRDFHLAFSPERIDPGNRDWTVQNTPKVVGGLTPQCAVLAEALLTHLTPEVLIVSTPRAAEMTKLLENTFRSVNIALVNELALLCERMRIDIWEVIEAASSKPFGFMPFRPGPGVGGHCIPVDPRYLSWKAREYDFHAKFIELAAEVNEEMPFHVVQLVARGLNRQGKPLRGARVLLLGVAFKADIEDARNSPAERIIQLLLQEGAQPDYHDPHVPRFSVGEGALLRQGLEMTSIALTEQALRSSDAVVVTTAHTDIDYEWVAQHAELVIDSGNSVRTLADSGKIVRLGSP